jgi:large-conductance mechanosensitive channel
LKEVVANIVVVVGVAFEVIVDSLVSVVCSSGRNVKLE